MVKYQKGKVNYHVSKKIILEIEKLVSKRSYDRRVLDQICHKRQ